MPELPEVEHAARIFAAAAVGRTIVGVRVLHASQRRHLSAADARRLDGARIAGVERRAKYQLVTTSAGVLLVHFRMNGDWHVDRSSAALPPYARVSFDLDDGSRISLVDSRALGSISLHASRESVPLPALGPEAADPSLSVTVLRTALRTRRGPIKPALLDQRVIAGLGNIYAAEALWNARVSPAARANGLSVARARRVITGAREALAAAARDPGRYADREAIGRLQVYGREGEPCDRCGTGIRRITQAGRSTFYCPKCQRV